MIRKLVMCLCQPEAMRFVICFDMNQLVLRHLLVAVLLITDVTFGRLCHLQAYEALLAVYQRQFISDF